MFVINELLEDIFESSSLMPRISPKPEPVIPQKGSSVEEEDETERDEEDIERKHQTAILENQTYIGEMRTDEILDNLRTTVVDRTRVIMEEAVAYKDKFEQYSYLWTVCNLSFLNL
jgi:dynein heavy chain